MDVSSNRRSSTSSIVSKIKRLFSPSKKQKEPLFINNVEDGSPSSPFSIFITEADSEYFEELCDEAHSLNLVPQISRRATSSAHLRRSTLGEQAIFFNLLEKATGDDENGGESLQVSLPIGLLGGSLHSSIRSTDDKRSSS
jgi:hypothetical protein